MKNLITASVLVCLFSLTAARAIGPYQSGDSLYCWAYHGLNLRSAPNSKAAVRRNIPLGARVLVLDSVRVKAYSVEEFPGFRNKGHWSKVRFQGLEGWVFDGYLSTYPVMRYTKQSGNFTEDFTRYADREFGRRSYRRLDLEQDRPASDTLSCRDIYTYRNGVVYERHRFRGDGGGAVEYFHMPNMSFAECYLFFIYNSAYFNFDPVYHPSPKPERDSRVVVESAATFLLIEWGTCRYTFEKKGGVTYIKVICSC